MFVRTRILTLRWFMHRNGVFVKSRVSFLRLWPKSTKCLESFSNENQLILITFECIKKKKRVENVKSRGRERPDLFPFVQTKERKKALV